MGELDRRSLAPNADNDEIRLASPPKLPRVPSASARKRLWLGGSALALFVSTIFIAGTLFSSREHAQSPAWKILGRDFLVYYCAGAYAREGRYAELHDIGAFMATQRATAHRAGLEIGGERGPWLNPPFFATAAAPLSMLSYQTAWCTWVALGATSLGISIVLLCRILTEVVPQRRSTFTLGNVFATLDWRHWALIPLLLTFSMPTIQTLLSGQNSWLSLLLLTCVVALWRRGHALPAGLVAGLMFFKPQLGAIVAAVLVVNIGRRALLGLFITGCALLLFTALHSPGALEIYLQKMPAALRTMQVDGSFVWNRHVTFNAFWHLLFHDRLSAAAAGILTRGLTLLCQGLVAVLLVRTVWLQRRSTGIHRDRLIAASVAAMPLLMPYYVDYDLLLLAVPAVLLSRELSHRTSDAQRVRTSADRWLPTAWAALYVWLFLNPAVAALTRVSLTAPLLTVVAGLLIRRSWTRGSLEDQQTQNDSTGAPVALAA